MENLDLKEVLQTMRNHSQPITFLANERDIGERESMLANLPFDSNPTHNKYLLEKNLDARVPICKYTNVHHWKDKFKCEEFKWSLTNTGFGITFNAADFWGIYRHTKYLKIFSDKMRPKSNNKNVLHTNQVGRAKDMLFIAQRSKFEHDDRNNLNSLILNLHNPLIITNFFDGAAIPIEYGKMTTITIMPSVIESLPDLQSIPLDKRKCLFDSERKLQLFKHYSQDGCMFECLLDLAYTATNCTPWNYPHLRDNQQTCNAGAISNVHNGSGFIELMQDANNVQNCEVACPIECNHLSYMPFDISVTPLDVSMCEIGFPFFWKVFWNSSLL